MKSYQQILTSTATLAFALLSSANADTNWHADYHKAAAEVLKAPGKLLLISFDGSGWVPFSDRLRKEVYSQPEFKDYANKNLVLLEVDFPRSRSGMPTVDQAPPGQNTALARKCGINPFDSSALPAIVLLNKEGKEVARLPYLPGGTPVFIAKVEKQLKRAGYAR